MKKGLYLTLNPKKTNGTFLVLILVLSMVMTLGVAGNFTDSLAVASKEYPTVIIDAGHGGEDGGTQSADGTLEKTINLEISQKLNSILAQKGFSTLMIREGDYMIYDDNLSSQREKKTSDIHNRLKAVEQNGDCILLSIHQNYFGESKYSGTQVFYSANHPDSKLLADSIQNSVISALQPDNKRQIKESESNIYLLYHSTVPSVMVECGFMSNVEEAQKLKNEDYQQNMAEAIAEGLIRYLENKPEGEINNGSENKKYFRVQ